MPIDRIDFARIKRELFPVIEVKATVSVSASRKRRPRKQMSPIISSPTIQNHRILHIGSNTSEKPMQNTSKP